MNERTLLTKAECNILRGMAITGIFLHNYCHWLNPIVKENEYTFTQSNVDWFTNVITSPDSNLPMHLMSYFGHYGVPIFIFLSAYGLEKKYGDTTKPKVGTGKFIGIHFLKLFKMMIIGFLAFLLIDYLTPNPFNYDTLKIIAQIGMFNNILTDPDDMIWPGPYWFFGLMLQLYIIYRLVLYRNHWFVTIAFITTCWLLQVFCDPEGETLNRLRYNFFGNALPFGLGQLYARYGKDLKKTSYYAIAILSSVLVIICSYNYQLWFFAPAFVCTGAVGFVKILPTFINMSFGWMGTLSAALFVCHPITRKIFIPISRDGNLYTGLFIYIISSIAIAYLYRIITSKIPSPKIK